MIRSLKAAWKYLRHSKEAPEPLVAYFMITNKCNLRCKMCNYWKGLYPKEVSTCEAKLILDKLADVNIQILSVTGGEPLMRRDISELLDYAKHTLKIPYVRLQTNATLLTKNLIPDLADCLDDVWISVDGVGTMHDYIRGVQGTFAKVEQNIHLLNMVRENGLNLIVNMVVTNYNRDQKNMVKQLAVDWHADHLFYHDVANVKAEESRQFSSEMNVGNVYYPDRRGCLILYSNLMINPLGELIPCGILDKLVVGNLLEQPVMEAWNSQEMRLIRKKVWRGLLACKQCCVPNTTLRSRLDDWFNLSRLV